MAAGSQPSLVLTYLFPSNPSVVRSPQPLCVTVVSLGIPGYSKVKAWSLRMSRAVLAEDDPRCDSLWLSDRRSLVWLHHTLVQTLYRSMVVLALAHQESSTKPTATNQRHNSYR